MRVLELQTWIDEFGEDQINTDELKDYLLFVKDREVVWSEDYYTEWHHVMPKCIDQKRKYISEGLRLKGSDHLRAHVLLVNCFSGTLKSKLSYAVSRMNPACKEGMTDEEYNQCKLVANLGRTKKYLPEESLKSMSIKTSLRVKGQGNPMYGKSLTEDQMQKRIKSFKETISRQKKEGNFKGAVSGFTIYNNGTRELHVYPEDEVPEGFVKGRLPFSEETCRKLSESLSNPSEEIRRRMSEAQKKVNIPREVRRQIQLDYISTLTEEEFVNRYVIPRQKENLSEETREKMSSSSSNRNSGRVWINDGTSNKFVKPEEVESYLCRGYFIGRIQSNKGHVGTFFINNGECNRLLHEGESIPEGWVKGMIRHKG